MKIHARDPALEPLDGARQGLAGGTGVEAQVAAGLLVRDPHFLASHADPRGTRGGVPVRFAQAVLQAPAHQAAAYV
jgi:hypothetical protein